LEWGTDSATDSTKMPLAGGTFTGDVTFSGDSSNGLWDKSASAFVANLTGNVTGNASGSAATVTGAAQSAITSVGTLTGLNVNGEVDIADGEFLDFGNGGLTIRTNSNNAYIAESTSGKLQISASNLEIKNANVTKTYLYATDGGSVDLYHNNVKTFSTVSNGIEVLGSEGGSGDIYLSADEGDDNADKWRVSSSSGEFKVGNYSTGSWVYGLTLDGSNNATFAGTITANNKVTCDNGSGSGFLYADGGSTKVGSFSNHRLDFVVNNAQKAKLETNGNFTVTAGTVSDSKGNLRSIPSNYQSSTYTLVAADAGKYIKANGTITIPNSVFSDGDAVTIVNTTGGDLTLTQASGLTLRNSADATTGNRILATRGTATILFVSGTEAYISGAGLS